MNRTLNVQLSRLYRNNSAVDTDADIKKSQKYSFEIPELTEKWIRELQKFNYEKFYFKMSRRFLQTSQIQRTFCSSTFSGIHFIHSRISVNSSMLFGFWNNLCDIALYSSHASSTLKHTSKAWKYPLKILYSFSMRQLV